MSLYKVYKKILESNFRFDGDFIYDYINSLHKKGWEKSEYEDKELIDSHSYFILKEIPLDDSNVKWNKSTYPLYYKRKGKFPPIVISSDGFVIDGNHRVASAIEKGDSTIQAYVGFK